VSRTDDRTRFSVRNLQGRAHRGRPNTEISCNGRGRPAVADPVSFISLSGGSSFRARAELLERRVRGLNEDPGGAQDPQERGTPWSCRSLPLETATDTFDPLASLNVLTTRSPLVR
jgi:hypothetical protein